MLNDLDADAPPPQHWGWKKILFGSVLFLTILAVAIIAYDEKLKPYDDLKPARDSVPDAATNGYLYLKARWQNLPAPAPADRDKINKMLAGTEPWDAAWVEKHGAEAATFQEELKQALQLPEFTTLVFLDFRDAGNDTHSWVMGPLRVLLLEIETRRRSSDWAGAIAIRKDLQAMVRRYLKGSNSLISFLVAASLNSLLCENTCHLLQRGNLDEAKLQELAALWQEEIPLSSIWEEVMKQETRLSRNGIEMLSAGGQVTPGKAVTLKERLFLKPNKTINELHRQRRPLLRQFSQIPAPLPAASPRQDPKTFRWIGYLGANFYGNVLLGDGHGYEKIFPSLTESVLFRPRALRVRIALHRWQLMHPGTWPATLQELVPDFLPEIPADPWNGAPLTWDAAAKTITAVGSDWAPGPAKFEPSRRSWYAEDRDNPGLRLQLPPFPVPAPVKPSKAPPAPPVPAKSAGPAKPESPD